MDGISIEDQNENELSRIRNKKIGFVFQAFQLIPRTSALKNVEIPMIYAGTKGEARKKKAASLLEKVGLGQRIHHMPNELSGGQKQRVAIARALANDPAIILADEPTGNLDTKASHEIMEFFTSLNDEGATVIVVTHEEDIAQYTKRIVRFQDGQVISDAKVALFSIKVNKMRSFLTMLGMIIGIGSVIAIVSLGDTMRSMFAQEYENIGTGLAGVYIMPEDGYFTENDYFKIEDREKFREAMGDDVTYVGFRYMDSAEARAGRKMENIYIETLAENPTAMEDLTIKHGRMLSDQDHYNKRKYVVMEQGTAMELFGVENAVGKTVNIKISGSEAEEYLIIGIYENTDSPLTKMMAGSGPKYAYIPEGALITEDSWNWSLYFVMDSEKDMTKIQNRVTAYIARMKNCSTDEVRINSAMEEMASIDSMLGGLSMVVGAIAAISLLVGGIGIMNIMLVSVTERTREIGIRKALGAQTRDIMIQFLIEAAAISAAGGAIGTALGISIVALGGMAFGIGVVVKPTVVAMAVSFSAVVGLGFGLYPARKAAKKDPVEALRYE